MHSNEGYGTYSPPKENKRHPLTRQDTKKLYRVACDWPEIETELSVRILLDYGLRVGELVHLRADWINKEYKRSADKELWNINIPKVEHCYGGKGDAGSHQNKSGINLHVTEKECSKCQSRSWQKKVEPVVEGERRPDLGWLSKEQAKKYGYHPKTERAATRVWEFPNVPETGETAAKTKKFLKTQHKNQWPHGPKSVRNRVNKLVEEADLTLPDRSTEEGVVPHALRHTYGCRLVEMQLGEGAGMKQMRHQDANVFEWYADVRDARVVRALDQASSEADSLLHSE
jgi:integrase